MISDDYIDGYWWLIYGYWWVLKGFPKVGGTPKMDLFVRGNPVKMDDLGVPLFQETSNLRAEEWTWN